MIPRGHLPGRRRVSYHGPVSTHHRGKGHVQDHRKGAALRRRRRAGGPAGVCRAAARGGACRQAGRPHRDRTDDPGPARHRREGRAHDHGGLPAGRGRSGPPA
ncbi:hypothetical protein [Achromobacter veterisilvae]|uniref:hypothetical protein n=1 Tax=Achromobacter veterisilvae TaxID=2069367 RepID=UPI003BB14FDA